MDNTETDIPKLVDHLFRHESGKLVSVLTRIFGSRNLDFAEDIVQDTLLDAINQWKYQGIPENPGAWLYKVAKYKALNMINREGYKRQYSSDAAHFLQHEYKVEPGLDHFFSEQEIVDDQVRMMFTCCHPSVSPDSQVALTLKTLCGFSIPEIAKAFITNEENINKRLVRARQTIREAKLAFDVPKGKELEQRLAAVLETIYLLFNEGYCASGGDFFIRYELCEEAIRIAAIISSHPAITQKEDVHALLSLMLLNASRFKSRQAGDGMIIRLEDQDRGLWDEGMIRQGISFLNKAIQGMAISKYHILATISAHHCTASSIGTTDWKSILSLYDSLLEIDNSPIVLLNRAVAVSEVFTAQKAIDELERIKNDPLVENYQYYYSTLGELYLRQQKWAEAGKYFARAVEISPVESEKAAIRKRLANCYPTT
jgi:RNA polymerase sigma factor (sigma-70 family)